MFYIGFSVERVNELSELAAAYADRKGIDGEIPPVKIVF
jgi:hypothetical protein